MPSLRFSALDVRLGGRMLVKHPALTLVATIAVAFAVAVGSVGFEIARQALWPAVPLPDGHAIVALRNWSAADLETVPASRRDYELWREGLGTITDLSAVGIEERSVAVGAGPGLPESIANVTASTFSLTRVPALIGRTLLEADERGDAADVAVVGYDFWKNRLGGEADVVGRVIRISGAPVTIVGVMPSDYGFPERSVIWRPMHLERLRDASPSLSYIVGRLAPGRTHDDATAEAATVGARAAAMFPETHRDVRLQVVSLPDAVGFWPEETTMVLASLNVFLVLLAALLCGNVAMLLFARAATREREFLVRTALGAGRGRIIMQLFAEALLLCAIGAVVGLLVARVVLAATWAMVEGMSGALPFWISTSLSTTTIMYAVGLTLFAATIAGFVPALKVTSRKAGRRLQAASSGGGGLQFGGVWTVVIVAQIALMTVLPAPLDGVAGDAGQAPPAGFPAEEYLTATLAIDRLDGDAASGDTMPAMRAMRLDASYRALADRLVQEPGVLGVTYANQMPVMRTSWKGIKMDSGPAAVHSERCVGGYCVGYVTTDPRFFDVIGAPVIRGRSLTTADAEHRTRAVLVNEFFVEEVLGGRNPIGRRFRHWSVAEPTAESWYEIVGVVPDLGVNYANGGDFGRARVFEATLPRATGPLRVAIHVRGDPQRYAMRLRELAQMTDPTLRVIEPQPMPQLGETAQGFWVAILLGLTGVTLMLSLAGVYAVTAFAVSRRTREIGVRVALGARPVQVLAAVFKRPMVQVAIGLGVGAVLSLGLTNNDLADIHLDDLARSAGFALITAVFCVLACIVPTRRALRVQPAEALKDEG